MEASLTAAIPYAALQVSERLKLWGAAGYGAGEVTLDSVVDWKLAVAFHLLPHESQGVVLAIETGIHPVETRYQFVSELAGSGFRKRQQLRCERVVQRPGRYEWAWVAELADTDRPCRQGAQGR
ncbi:MAG: hypothetical protein OXI15_21765 [Chromatiales bacterium]|nr:hypothetical protein [Chromatiales bacterium]